MSPSQLYLLQNRLRLLARADVIVDANGDYVAGRIRPHFEAARLLVSNLGDQVLDGQPLTPLQTQLVRRLGNRIHRWLWPLVRQLELETL
jgi:hypothetical protein